MQETPDLDPVLAEVEAFLDAQQMTATAFGVKCLGDPTFVHELRGGRECKRATVARVRAFIVSAEQSA